MHKTTYMNKHIQNQVKIAYYHTRNLEYIAIREASHLSKDKIYFEHPTLINQVNFQEMLSL